MMTEVYTYPTLETEVKATAFYSDVVLLFSEGTGEF